MDFPIKQHPQCRRMLCRHMGRISGHAHYRDAPFGCSRKLDIIESGALQGEVFHFALLQRFETIEVGIWGEFRCIP